MNNRVTASLYPEPQPMNRTSTDLVLNFGQIFGILKRGWWVIAGAGFIGTLIAVILVLQVTPSYTSSAKLLLGQKSRVDDAMGAMFPDLRLDDAAVSGEIAILTSARLLSQVSQSLDLGSHPDFNPALTARDEEPGYAEQATDWVVDQIKRVIGIDTEATPAMGTGDEPVSPVRDAAMTGKSLLGDQSDYVDALGGNLRVSQEGRSNLLTIRYISTDRMLAAAVPNRLVDLYLEDQIDRRFDVLSRVTSGLETRLEAMRDRLEESERAVIDFRSRNFSEGFASRIQIEQQLADLSERLGTARVEYAELASDLEGIDTMIENQGAPATAGLFSSSVIESLLEELAGLRERSARLMTQFGEDNPQLGEVQSEIDRLEASLTKEVLRLRDDRARMVELSSRRNAALREELRTLEQRAIEQAEREVRLAQLEREQNAARMVYQTFLDRFTETRETVEVQEGDAQVIDYADPPPSPFAPNKKLSAVLGGLAGGFLGIALVFIQHLARNKISTALELERLVPAFSVVPIPRLRRLLRRADPLAVSSRGNFTMYGEAVRTLRNTLLLAVPAGTPKVVSVVSPLAGAGKTTTAINLARSISGMGRSCVLVDADLRCGDISELMHIGMAMQLNDLLASEDLDLDTALQKDPESNLRVITAGSRVADPGGALLSKGLHVLISKLKDRFEVIVFDTAPLLSGTDALPLIQHSDAVVMVVPRGSDFDEVRVASGKLGKFAPSNRIFAYNFARSEEVEAYY